MSSAIWKKRAPAAGAPREEGCLGEGIPTYAMALALLPGLLRAFGAVDDYYRREDVVMVREPERPVRWRPEFDEVDVHATGLVSPEETC